MSDFDYTEFEEPETSSDKMQSLTTLAEAWEVAQQELKEAEENLRLVQDKIKRIEEVDVPEIMDELKMESFATTNGIDIGVKEKVRCSIPKSKQSKAFEWLRDNGFGPLIKRTMKLEFGMGEENYADEFLQRNEGLEISDNETVHNQTLVALVKRRLEAGEDVPEECFSVLRQRVASFNKK